MPSRHALIIEDEMMIAMEVESLLEDLGFDSFSVASTPSEAVACVRERRPALVTADYRILEGTGIEAVAAIVSEIGPVPVVYITGSAAEIRAPGRCVVEKPIRRSALAEACREVGGAL
jgi:CheY-like chemotaxis protein